MHYHIVGIAGAGMSAIANLLLDQGHSISGSDLASNRQTAALAARGATIYSGHSPDYVRGADAVLATAAVRAEHPELAAARSQGIQLLKRGDLWRDWSQQRKIIAIAGTHGKTTTSAMVALALRGAGLNPGFLIGADVPDLGGNAAWGDPSDPLVIEADEYDRVFLSLQPEIAIITNIEWDHPDIYPSAESYLAAFTQFAQSVANPRHLILCGDDQGIGALPAPDATYYGIEEQLEVDPVSCRLAPLDWTASGLKTIPGGGVTFNIWNYRRMAQRRIAEQTLAMPGAHNVRNAMAALAVVALLGHDLAAASRALSQFRGSARRFELKGEAAGITVIDDYAHHPTEVRATLAAARQRYPGRRIVAYLQPHTFSRTEALRDEWPAACADADRMLIGDVYAAREQGDAYAVSQDLASRIASTGIAAQAVGTPAQAAQTLIALAEPGDVVLTLGAGNGDRVGTDLLTHLNATTQPGR